MTKPAGRARVSLSAGMHHIDDAWKEQLALQLLDLTTSRVGCRHHRPDCLLLSGAICVPALSGVTSNGLHLLTAESRHV